MTYTEIEKNFNNVRNKWTIDEYEEFYLKRISETRADTNYYTDRYGEEHPIAPVNNFPKLKEYEVWSEGYSITGGGSGATLEGKTFARNFAQACDIVMCKKRIEWIEKVNDPNYKEYCPPSTWDYNPRDLSNWGCRLFWSKELASKSFG